MKALPHLVCLALKAAGNSPGRNYLTSRGCSAPAEFPQLSASICTKLHKQQPQKKEKQAFAQGPCHQTPLLVVLFLVLWDRHTVMNLGPQKSFRNPALKLWNAKAATILPMEPKSLSLAGQCQVQTAHSHPGSAFFVGCSLMPHMDLIRTQNRVWTTCFQLHPSWRHMQIADLSCQPVDPSSRRRSARYLQLRPEQNEKHGQKETEKKHSHHCPHADGDSSLNSWCSLR